MGYQEIEVQQGAFIGWGTKPGQIVEGVVTDYDPEGATDFNKKVCPALELELTRTAHSFSQKHGEWSTYEAGETVNLTCGLVQLKKKVRKAQPRIGDMIRIELKELIAVDSGTVKSFQVDIDRGAGAKMVETRDAAAAFNGSGSGGGQWDNTPPSAPDEPPMRGDDEPPF